MHTRVFIFFLLLTGKFNRNFAQPLTPIGQWSDHLPYSKAIRVGAINNEIIAATPYAIFSVDKNENSVWKKSRINGLSETGIVDMKAGSNRIIIIYSSGSIDIIENEKVYTIDDIKRNNNRDPVNLYHLTIENSTAYISSSIGIIQIDLERKEISSTFIIGNNGDKVNVLYITIFQNRIYASTTEGIKSAPLQGLNLQDFRNWSIEDSFFNDIIFSTGDKLYAVRNDSIFKHENPWEFIYKADPIRTINSSSNQIIIAHLNGIDVIDSEGLVLNKINNGNGLSNPLQAIVSEDELWIADGTNGLIRYNGSYQNFSPASPLDIISGEMIYTEKGLLATAGKGVSQKNDAGIFQFINREWKNFSSINNNALQNIKDISTIAYDVSQDVIWVGSSGNGLIKFYKENNIDVFAAGSFVSPAFNDPVVYNVSGLAFDQNKTLWIANDGAMDPIIAYTENGTAYKFRPPFSLPSNSVGKIIIDDIGQKWIIAPQLGLICFNDNNTPANPGDDQWKLYTTGQGNGNLPTTNVLDIVKDRNNFIWIGTSSGIAIIQCTEQVFGSQICDATLPVVQQGNFAGYLFRGEMVQAIAIDGANRKWIGTRNGLWLISEDGEKTIERFTSGNSPLPSNIIHSIAIDDLTGEVFIATDKGLVSFRGTATGIVNEINPVKVFPNPVPPGYNGTIAIRGVPANSIVKITELNGRLVFQGRANGTQFIWNGKTYQGNNVATGVYLVMAMDGVSGEKLLTKIVIVGK